MPDSDHDIDLIVRALSFAARKHRHQRRKDAEASPYINHPIELAEILVHEGGVRDPVVLSAAILHDTIEDTETTFDELVHEFGGRIAGIVAEVTDDTTLRKEERKRLQVERARRSSSEAKLVKLADKIDNLRDMLSAPPAGWTAERKRAYFSWAAEVVAGLRGCNSALEDAFDRVFVRAAEVEDR